MFTNARYSSLIIRFSIAFTFLWFGVDKFIHPTYWIQAWLPQWLLSSISTIGLTGYVFIYLNGVFEILVAISLISGIFIKLFSFLGIIFLAITLFSIGFSEITVRDITIIGVLCSVLLLPQRYKR